MALCQMLLLCLLMLSLVRLRCTSKAGKQEIKREQYKKRERKYCCKSEYKKHAIPQGDKYILLYIHIHTRARMRVRVQARVCSFCLNQVPKEKSLIENSRSIFLGWKCFSFIGNRITFVPVSYTHLDVYKRQTESCPFLVFYSS